MSFAFPFFDLASLHQFISNVSLNEVHAEGASSPEDFQNEVNEIRSKLDSIVNRIQGSSAQLDKDVLNSAHDSIDALAAAVGKMYDVAVFIRGDYDNREVDENKKKLVLGVAVEAFERAQRVAEDGLTRIGDIQGQVTEMEQTELIPTQERLDVIAQQNNSYLQSVKASIADSERSVQVFSQSVLTESNSIATLQQKISSSEAASTASDVFFSIITLGIGNAINHGPLDPFNLHGQLDDARRAYNEAWNNLNNANNQLANLRNTLSLLQVRLSVQKQIQDTLPGIQTRAHETMSKIIMLEKQFAAIKDTSTKLLLNIRHVQNSALVTSSLAYTKQEFAVGILKVAEDSLIDAHLIEPARNIEKEIMGNYGRQIPNEVEDTSRLIDEKLAVLSKVQSIKGITLG